MSGGEPYRPDPSWPAASPAKAPPIAAASSTLIGMTAVGLGAWGVLFPQSVRRTLGVQASPMVVRILFGARELWSGFNLTSNPARTPVLWARVAADLFDLAILGRLAGPVNPKRGAARTALAFVAMVTALDLATAARMTAAQRR